MYDVNSTILDDVESSNMFYSVYLAKKQYKYIINNNINYIINMKNQLNLYKTYINIKKYINYSSERETATTCLPTLQYYYDKSRIYDPETALRLSELLNVKPYLDPITDFDKNLMHQFGLYY